MKRLTRTDIVAVMLSVAIGVVIAYVDSRVTWDDAGITAGALFVTSAVAAAVSPRAAWIVGFATGLPVVAFNIALHGNVGSLFAIVVTLIGAVLGRFVGKTIGRSEMPGSI